ncbi:hypothetical protein [Mesonia sp.]|uniref:hypothetical protein n=1 Tax=Mesonia sp. TaxID=1960830 RepID=UPI001771FB5A|nr:hypothetical protein [Mesonia sp.]HIB37527.1 hypothetical protein [Mesonia sp.]HIO27791.1 hypothetical protein [Flavobacteriaceae bacterium]
MKKEYYLIVFSLLFINYNFYSQVGVNTTNPQATLDVQASNSSSPSNSTGLLVPRISAFPSSNPGSSQNGMMVYLTATVGSNTPGFYYWDNAETEWVSVGSSASSDSWNLNGNSGTDSDSNFLGTTDSESLVFRTNNIEKLRLTSGGRLETYNTGFSVFLGEGAGANDDLTSNYNLYQGYNAGTNNTAGQFNIALGAFSLMSNQTDRNVAVGYNTLRNNTTGFRNTSVGDVGMFSNTTGSFNTSVGSLGLNLNTTGSFNSSLGYQSLRSNDIGSRNVSVGSRSSNDNESGNNNVSIGFSSLYTNITGSGNIAIGYQAGYDEITSNKLYIENSDSNIPLIGGNFTSDRLGVNVAISALTHTLTVGGDISATGDIETTGDFVTESNTYPDYVFEDYYNGNSEILPTYSFKTLKEVEAFIKTNGHLPGVKSYKEVEEEGFKIKLGTTSITNLEKIEESFLYIIELNNKLELQEKELQEKDQKIEELEQRLLKIEKMLEK